MMQSVWSQKGLKIHTLKQSYKKLPSGFEQMIVLGDFRIKFPKIVKTLGQQSVPTFIIKVRY